MQYREDWYKVGTYGVNPATGKYEAYQTGQTNPGYYDHPDNLGRYGVTQEQWMAYSKNESGESALSIYAKRLGLEDAVLRNFLTGKLTTGMTRLSVPVSIRTTMPVYPVPVNV